MRRLILFLSLTGACYGNACTTAGGTTTNWSATTTWTSCGGLVPQAADTWTFTKHIVVDANINTASGTIAGPNAQLVTDGLSPHSITTTGGIAVTQGCTAVGGGCTSAYAIDTSAGSASNLITWTRTGATSLQPIITAQGGANEIDLNLTWSEFAVGNGALIDMNSGAATSKTYISNSHFTGGSMLVWNETVWNTISVTNVSSDGFLDGGAFYFNFFYSSGTQANCSFTNVTIRGTTSNQYMFKTNGDNSTCVITGNALQSDAAGVHNTGFFSSGASASTTTNLSYNILRLYNATSYSFTTFGTSSAHSNINHNVANGGQALSGPYTDYSDNVFLRLGGTSVEGPYFVYGVLNNTSTRDIGVTDQDGSTTWEIIGNGTSQAGQMVVARATQIGASPFGHGSIRFGETNGAQNFLGVTGSSLSNSISINGAIGIECDNGQSVFTTGGTGGVGVWNNLTYNNSANAYAKNLSIGVCANFDNGTTPHPNAIYGDISTVNPGLPTAAQTRKFPQCDEILGNLTLGTGTDDHLFQMLAARWNNGASLVGADSTLFSAGRYTTQNIYSCMRAGYAPREVRLATSGQGGTIIGALAPTGLVGMAFSQ